MHWITVIEKSSGLAIQVNLDLVLRLDLRGGKGSDRETTITFVNSTTLVVKGQITPGY